MSKLIYRNSNQPVIITNRVPAVVITGQSHLDRRVAVATYGASPVDSGDGTIPGLKMFNAVTNVWADFDYGSNTGSFTNNTTDWGHGEIALKYLRDYLGQDIYIIQGTKGNTSVAPNAGRIGSWYCDPANTKYPWIDADQANTVCGARMKERIDNARYAAAKINKTLYFIGGLHMQNEGDRGSPYNALHAQRTLDFFAYLRSWCHRSDMPIITYTIPTASIEYDSTVDTGVRNYAANSANNCYLVDMASQPRQADGVHLNDVATLYGATETYNIAQTVFTF